MQLYSMYLLLLINKSLHAQQNVRNMISSFYFEVLYKIFIGTIYFHRI